MAATLLFPVFTPAAIQFTRLDTDVFVVGTLVILIAVAVWAMDILSARIREKIV